MTPAAANAATPAEACGQIIRAIRAADHAVEVQMDFAWIFLRRPGYSPADLGDTETRRHRLGKWIASVPRAELVQEAVKFLPLIHDGRLTLCKIANVWNFPAREPAIVVYCCDRDASVLLEMRRLGHQPRWKFNFETFGESE
jgi:hypothetical protein